MRRLRALADLMMADPAAAGRQFIAEASERSCELMLECAERFTLETCRDFEQHGVPVLIEGKFGRFWLAPAGWRRALLPPAPRFAPDEFREFGLAVRDTLLDTDGGTK